MHYISVEKIIRAKEMELETKNRELEAKGKELEEVKKAFEEVKNNKEEAKNVIKDMLFDSIAELGKISKTVHECIKKEEDINILKSMYKAVMKAESMEQLEEQIANL